MRKTLLPLVIVVGIISLGMLSLYVQGVPKSPTRPALDLAVMSFDEKNAYWESRIRIVGGPAAYREIAEAIKEYPVVYEQHGEVHVFGDALYRVEGLKGIATCDGRFLYACFHAFSIRGVQELGTDGVQQLYDACREALGETSSQCEHGIGHGLLGILESDEYTTSELLQALAVCNSLTPQSDPTFGCAGGVFMEFGVHSMNTGTAAPRQFRSEIALEPCVSIPDGYLKSCVFWQPTWWIQSHPDRRNHTLMARKMGEWCLQFSASKSVIENCFNGIGNQIQRLTEDTPSQTAAICSAATSDSNLLYTCHTRSAKRFTFYHSLAESLRACDGLPEHGAEACRTEAKSETEQRRRDIAKYGSSFDELQ